MHCSQRSVVGYRLMFQDPGQCIAMIPRVYWSVRLSEYGNCSAASDRAPAQQSGMELILQTTNLERSASI